MDTPGRNSSMAERIGSTPVRYPFSFVVAGDSGAWPDPTADGIYSQLLRQVGEVDIRVDVPVEGPREEALEFLERSLEAADTPHRVVLTHMPPHLGGRYEPHPEWGFQRREDEFLSLLRRHGVGLVCCAHGLAFDHHVHDGTHFVMSGGGGTGLCSDFRGICAEGEGQPADRGSLFHLVEIHITEAGSVSGRVLQAFEPEPSRVRLRF
jgi:hypothetical protein